MGGLPRLRQGLKLFHIGRAPDQVEDALPTAVVQSTVQQHELENDW